MNRVASDSQCQFLVRRPPRYELPEDHRTDGSVEHRDRTHLGRLHIGSVPGILGQPAVSPFENPQLAPDSEDEIDPGSVLQPSQLQDGGGRVEKNDVGSTLDGADGSLEDDHRPGVPGIDADDEVDQAVGSVDLSGSNGRHLSPESQRAPPLTESSAAVAAQHVQSRLFPARRRQVGVPVVVEVSCGEEVRRQR